MQNLLFISILILQWVVVRTDTLCEANGADSAAACVCQSGSYSPFSDAVVAFNPANEVFDGSRVETLNSVDMNFQSTGITIVLKVKFERVAPIESDKTWEHVFNFGNGQSGNIFLSRYAATTGFRFEIDNDNGDSQRLERNGGGYFQYNDWCSVYLRYSESRGMTINIDGFTAYQEVTGTITDRTFANVYIGKSAWTNPNFLGQIAGLYAFDRYLSDAEAEAVLATIQTGALDDPLHTACVACGVGLTTLTAGASSSGDCVCQKGSYSPFSDAVIKFNPPLNGPTETFDGSNFYEVPAPNLTPETNGFTIVTKFKYNERTDWNPIVDFRNAGTHYITLAKFYQSNSETMFFAIHLGDLKCTFNHISVPFNTDVSMYARYKHGEELEVNVDGTPLSQACTGTFAALGTTTMNHIGRYGGSTSLDWRGSIYGAYVFNRYLTDTEAEAVLDMIKVGGLDDPLQTSCTSCPSEKPYTEPSQGATSADQCQTPADECAAVTPVVSTNDPYTADVFSGLIAQYQFNDYGSEEGVLDSSGNGKTLTAYNAQYEDFAFKTTDQVDYFEVANDGYFSPQKFTISVWIKYNTGFTALNTVASCRENPGFKGWMIYLDKGHQFRFWTGTTSKWDTTTIDSALDGTWQNFVITLDGSSTTDNVEIFRNKVSLGKYSHGYVRALVNNMRIGEGKNEASISSDHYPLASGSYLDEFRLYDRVLTLSEIEAVYDYRLPVLSGDVTSSMVKYLRFPEGLSSYTLNFPTATTADFLVVSGSNYRYTTNIPVYGNLIVSISDSTTVQQDYILIKENAWCDGGVTYTNKYTHSNNPQKDNGKEAIEQSCFVACSAHASFNIREDTGACYCFDASSEECTWDTDSSYSHYDIVAVGVSSVVKDAAGTVVATSAGGTEYQLPRWVLGAAGATCDATCNAENMQCDPSALLLVDSQAKIDQIMLDEFGITCLAVTGGAGRSYAGTPFINADNKCYYWNYDVGQVLPAPVCDANDAATHRPLCRCVPATTGFDHAITGETQAYASPQVILRYNAIVCPTTDTDKPKCGEWVSVFSYWSIRKC